MVLRSLLSRLGCASVGSLVTPSARREVRNVFRRLFISVVASVSDAIATDIADATTILHTLRVGKGREARRRLESARASIGNGRTDGTKRKVSSVEIPLGWIAIRAYVKSRAEATAPWYTVDGAVVVPPVVSVRGCDPGRQRTGVTTKVESLAFSNRSWCDFATSGPVARCAASSVSQASDSPAHSVSLAYGPVAGHLRR